MYYIKAASCQSCSSLKCSWCHPIPGVPLLKWREYLFWGSLPMAYYVTHSHAWSCALHTTCSVVHRGPTSSHTLLPNSQKWSHLLLPTISDISVKKWKSYLTGFSLKLLYWDLAQTPRRKRAHRRQRWVTHMKTAPSFIQALVPLPTLWVRMTLP